jgi:hypothetical protein
LYGTGLEWVAGDSESYLAQARALSEGEFVTYFPNGLPAVIAGIWAVVGREVLDPLVWLNVLFSVGVAVGVFYMARDWFESSERGAGLVGAVLACLLIAHWPNHLRFVPRILTDIPATFLVTAGLWALLSRRGLLAGVSFGLAVTFRPSLLPIWIGAVGLALVRRDVQSVGRCVAAGLVPVGALVGYGFIQTGEVSIGGNLSYNLLKGIGAYRDGFQLEQPGANISTVGALGTYVEFVWSHPWMYIRQRVFELWELWGPWPSGGDRSLLSRFVIGWRTPLLLLAGWGFWRRREEWRSWVFALPAVALTGVHLFFFGHPRFILPAEPGLAILASEGLRGTFVWRAVARTGRVIRETGEFGDAAAESVAAEEHGGE